MSTDGLVEARWVKPQNMSHQHLRGHPVLVQIARFPPPRLFSPSKVLPPRPGQPQPVVNAAANVKKGYWTGY